MRSVATILCGCPLSHLRRIWALLPWLLLPLAAQAQQAAPAPLIAPFTPIPPLMYLDAEGGRSGFFTALAEEVAREVDLPLAFLDVPDPPSVTAAQVSGRTQIVAGITRIAPMAASHVYSDVVATDRLRYAALVENIGLLEQGPVTAKRIGIVPPTPGSSDPELARNTPVPYANVEAALFGLLTGEVDALLLPPPAVFRMARDAGIDGRIAFGGRTVREVTRHVALHQSRADLLPAVNAAIARLEARGVLEDLRRRFSIEVPPPEPEVLRVLIADAPPYGILGADGSVSGYAADLFRTLAARASLRFEFVPVPLEGYFTPDPASRFDVIPFVLASAELSPGLDLTLPIDSAQLEILVREEDTALTGWQDLAGARVGSFPDTVSIARERGFAAEMRAYDSAEALARALRQGEIAAIMEVGHTLAGEGLTERFRSIGGPEFTVDNVVGLRPGLGTARERLNAVIPGYLLSEDYAALRQRYFSDPVFWTAARLYYALAGAVASLCLLTAYQLRERQRQRQRAFAQQERELLREQAHARELTALVRQLEQANREQAEFTYAISHDLKSPANTIGLLIDVLAEEGGLDAEAQELLADMARTNNHMRQLVDDVLTYSRLVGEEMAIEEVDLTALVEGICGDLKSAIDPAGARLEIGRLPVIRGNRMQLRMLFQNLISNAVKFRRPDRAPRITLHSRSGPEGVSITLADNGIGIPEQHRHKVFGLFQRLHDQSTYEGTGLGLTICKRVMSKHGGDIRIGPGIDGGTAFTLTFPGGPP